MAAAGVAPAAAMEGATVSALSTALLAVLDEVWPPEPDPVEVAVWVDPRRQAGQPCVYGTRVPVTTVVDGLWIWGTAEEVADAYDLTRAQVIAVAVTVALNPALDAVAGAWHQWASEHAEHWRAGRWAEIPDPPSQRSTRP